MTDKELLDKIYKTKNTELFEIFINRYQTKVYQKAYMFSLQDKEKAEKLAIEIFLELWNKILNHKYIEPIDRWVSGVAIKLGYEQYKKLKKNWW